jgi:hypothetical protein
MRNIETILNEIKEDKCHNLSTTSFKFKTDVWDFFQLFNDKVAVEFGTNKGQTTRLLSFLFKHVYTVNINDNLDAIKLNHDITNITYISNFDLYNHTNKLNITETVSLFFIDAGHQFQEIVTDINRVTSMNCDTDCYLLFDDYGSSTNTGIKQAVDLAVNSGAIEIIKFIGHESGHNFGNAVKGGPDRILCGPEGVITKVIWH